MRGTGERASYSPGRNMPSGAGIMPSVGGDCANSGNTFPTPSPVNENWSHRASQHWKGVAVLPSLFARRSSSVETTTGSDAMHRPATSHLANRKPVTIEDSLKRSFYRATSSGARLHLRIPRCPGGLPIDNANQFEATPSNPKNSLC